MQDEQDAELIEKTPTQKAKKLHGNARTYAMIAAEHKEGLQALAGQGVDISKPFVPYSAVKKAITGRPSLYDESKHPEAIYNLMTPPICLTREAAALSMGIGLSTLYEWVDKYPAFADALRAAEFLGDSYHGGRLASGSVKYAQGLIFYMKNRHGWKDKSEIEHSRKVDDLVKDGDAEANRVDWRDIAPSGSSVSGTVIDAEVVEEDED